MRACADGALLSASRGAEGDWNCRKALEMTMPNVREPLLNPVPITELRPTQITVGMREVKAKRKHWREQVDGKGAEFLGKHMIPVILGPKQRHYVIDHHHLAL